MYAKVNSLGLFGLNAFSVEAEVDISRGAPMFDIVGLGDQVVRESRERIRAAMRASDIGFPLARVMVNLAPADTKKSGSVHDMAILAAILAATGNIPAETSQSSFIGEVALNGDVRPVSGVLPMVLLARCEGIKNVFVPADNAYEASVADGINVYGVKNIRELLEHLSGGKLILKQDNYIPPNEDFACSLDFADVRGQQNAKKALEIAAAGGHNALLIGSPGSGKSMLAKRMPSILPEMTFEESVETTNVYSVAGLLDKRTPLITVRPFRAPHHTISAAGLSGGGSIPRPGEISLAHNGLLFLDELAEFDRRTLEILRQPLEDGKVTISRASGTVSYPCSIMLIGAMNPCPCGNYGNPRKKCICTRKQVLNYLSKISGPMLDRFDLHIEVSPVEYEHIASKAREEDSASIRQRIKAARDIQNRRFLGTKITCNARISPDMLQETCLLNARAEQLLKNFFEKTGMSARGYDRILKVSRTIADIDGEDIISAQHISQAVQYRTLDRKYWIG